jgi:hypothetical protein
MTTRQSLAAALISVTIAVPALPLLPGGTAGAIPAFARKYRVSCTMCHVAAPKLKPYGEEFAGNGFVLPDGEEPKRATIDTGDTQLLLQTDLPLAVRIDAYLRGQESTAVDADLQVPYGLKLLSGGRVTRNISYYFYFYVFERGEVAGLEDAYLHFNNIRGSEFDVMAGQFQVSDPLFKRELRLEFEDYLIYRFRPGESQANLTYDRGLMFTYGFDFGLDLVAQLLNGNGIPAAEDRVFDVDTQKASALRASQALGPVRVGAFGYYNEEKNEFGTRNDVYYAGGDATIDAGEKWQLNLQYLRRNDSNAFFVAPDSTDTKTDGGFAELIFMPRGSESRWLFSGLYNVIESGGDLYDTRRLAATVNYMVARNMRFLVEYTFDADAEKSEGTLGFMGAF